MMLTQTELDRLTLHTAAELARKRRARGLRLNLPEAQALLCDEALEAARDGQSLDDVMSFVVTVLTSDDVLPDVPELLGLLSVEAMFEDGAKTVTVWQPIRPGKLAREKGMAPGAVLVEDGEIELNAGSEKAKLTVLNTGDRPVHVSSHYHFFEANRKLEFDRAGAFGFRLDLPAGATARFNPGESKEITLTQIAGTGEITGLNRLTEGSVHDPAVKAAALERAHTRGFKGA
ncbi:MAG: urease subunit beta [Rhodospirillaceae bacterium]|nr:urease subunit beta [Rhodospirillaceae bacterium]MBT6513086.1 urease subunit beta [Rhodospirillaceae bacterium]